MSTNRIFNDMLNEYLTVPLMKEEMIKRDYVYSKIEKDESWKSGTLPVPFRGARASSVKAGGLTDAADIASSSYIRGTVTEQVEFWSSLKFNHRDLQEHNGKIPESTFLRILPDEIDDMMDYFKEVISIQMGSGPHFAKVTDATNAATGIMVVDKVDRFVLGQKAVLVDDNSAIMNVYVKAINLNTKEVTFSATRGGAAADVSAYTVAQNAKFYHDGVTADGTNFTTFTSMRSALLSAANGGSATLHGKSKLAYPHLQAINVLGSSITASNILDKLFDAYTEVRTRARGNANTYLMSFKHIGSVMKLLQAQKGPYQVTKDPTASLYGWTEIVINSVKGELTLVAIQEMDDDVIFMLDWKALKFVSNGGFKKRVSPDGLQYHEVRESTGFYYICDVSIFGEVVYTRPSNCGVIYSISY